MKPLHEKTLEWVQYVPFLEYDESSTDLPLHIGDSSFRMYDEAMLIKKGVTTCGLSVMA